MKTKRAIAKVNQKITYEKLFIRDITLRILKDLYRNSYKENGMLFDQLIGNINQYVENATYGHWDKKAQFIVVARAKNKIVGWGIRDNTCMYNIMLYVNTAYRRIGIGTELFKRCKGKTKNRYIHVAREQQIGFFSSVLRRKWKK